VKIQARSNFLRIGVRGRGRNDCQATLPAELQSCVQEARNLPLGLEPNGGLVRLRTSAGPQQPKDASEQTASGPSSCSNLPQQDRLPAAAALPSANRNPASTGGYTGATSQPQRRPLKRCGRYARRNNDSLRGGWNGLTDSRLRDGHDRLFRMREMESPRERGSNRPQKGPKKSDANHPLRYTNTAGQLPRSGLLEPAAAVDQRRPRWRIVLSVGSPLPRAAGN
jgi:hypothetical protein